MSMQDDSHSSYSEALDQALQAAVGRLTRGISPAALMLAFFDWYLHLAIHPAKNVELIELNQKNFLHLLHHCINQLSGEFNPSASVDIPSRDKRFNDPAWQKFPFSYIYESFLMMQEWWDHASSNVRGVSDHHANVVNFTIRQILDMMSPTNYPLLNPEIIKSTLQSGGKNFLKGYENFIEDFRRYQANEPPIGAENYIIGKNVATAKGSVIYRNDLIELIQYQPKTQSVYAEPILITPAWIMKYYILDLTPKHSLVNYLLKHGHTVFMISWKNPTKKEADLGLEDYLNLGVMSAIDIVKTILPKEKIHLVGYCLGGTLAAIAAASLAKNKDENLASLTLFAAQTDFNDPGELGLFIDESQISFLEHIMKEKGYLDTHQMAGAFQLLRSNDLIWSRIVHDYLLGMRKPLNSLMAWNADATRLPYRMHSEYLRQLFLHNQLAESQFFINGQFIALQDIDIPIFTVATERDHVSPWHSVFKINLLTTTEVTFALTSGGHNVGIVSMPGAKIKRHYRILTLAGDARYIDSESWFQMTKAKSGSWWPAWRKWIDKLSSEQIPPPAMGSKKNGIIPIQPAPGSYVLEK